MNALSDIEHARALAAYWRERADDAFATPPWRVAKYRETADLLERLAAELERP